MYLERIIVNSGQRWGFSEPKTIKGGMTCYNCWMKCVN